MPPGKLDTARVFERVFGIYRAQASVLLPAALIVYLIPAALGAAGSIWLQAAASFIGAVYYQGLVVQAVRDIQDHHRDLSLGRLFRSVVPALGPLLWTAILIALGVGLGFVLFVLPGLWLATQWAVAVPVVVCEARSAPQALTRSHELVRGNGWRVFSVLAVSVLLVLIADTALAAIVNAFSSAKVAYVVATLVSNAVTAPVLALAATVLYLELLQLHGEPLPPADMASFR